MIGNTFNDHFFMHNNLDYHGSVADDLDALQEDWDKLLKAADNGKSHLFAAEMTQFLLTGHSAYLVDINWEHLTRLVTRFERSGYAAAEFCVAMSEFVHEDISYIELSERVRSGEFDLGALLDAIDDDTAKEHIEEIAWLGAYSGLDEEDFEDFLYWLEDDTDTDWEEMPEIWKAAAYVGDFFGVEKFLSENPDYPVDWADLTIALAMYSAPYSSAERRLFYCRHRDNIPFMRIIKFFGEVSSTRRFVIQIVIEAVLPEAVLEVVGMIQEDEGTAASVKQARLEKLREAFPLIATTEVISEAMSGVRL